jgi:hypothetical protein
VAVLGRLLISSAERIDLPDLLSIDSYTAGDFKFLLKGLVGDDKPFVLKGFDIIDPENAIGTQSCSIRVADSIVFHPGSTAGPFFHGLPEGHVQALPLVPELRKNAVNYVYLTFSTFNSSVDTRAFWDPDKDGGVGGEFTQDVNTESVLKCDVNVSVGSFPSNTIPIAKITVGPVVITAIEDARDLMFRLGTGGVNPNPYNSWNWRSLPDSGYQRSEPSTIMTAGGENPFQGADKNIWTLKEWMDAVMSKLKELGGTTFWYEDASSFSLIASFVDALATTFQTKGIWEHSSATPGLITWTEDLKIIVTADPREYVIRAGSVQLDDGQVAYVSRVRNGLFNNSDQVVAWTNGQPYVNTVGGAIGLFANLSKGDLVKKPTDPNSRFLRVEEFYDSVNLGGSTTTAGNAKSIRLNGNYAGATGNDKGRYDKGFYTAGDVQVADRDDAGILAAGGNFHWLAVRADTIENVSNIAVTSLSLDIEDHDGVKAKATSGAAHGLIDGDRVEIVGSTNYDGIYDVEVESTTEFYFHISGGPFADESSVDAYYATVTTAARSNAYGLQLESANHGFATDDTIIVDGTTNFDGSYPISVRSATTFTIPVGAPIATETSGTATLARVIIRQESGSVNLIQGESGGGGGDISANVKLFLGMQSDSQVHPNYTIAPSYNTLDGQENFNSAAADNVTARLSKLTAMMADRAQDKTIKYLTNDDLSVVNTQNGAAQEITFTPSGSFLTIIQPGSPGNAVIALPDSAPGISLLVNQLAYVTINRNLATTPTIQVANTADLPISENTFIIAARATTDDIVIWSNLIVGSGTTPISGSGAGLRKVRLHDPLSTVLPTGAVSVDSVTVDPDDLVLFSNLSSDDNQIYKAVGTIGNITSWIAQAVWSGSPIPGDGDSVIVQEGISFSEAIGIFDGTEWRFNNRVRYYNGQDYWEQSSLNSAALANNQVSPADIFAINWAGSENIIVDYSILRGSAKETGTITITTDGTNVGIATGNVDASGSAGVLFSAVIVGAQIHLQYTSDNSGSPGQVKWLMRRWSDAAGGPGGIPSYSGGGGSPITGAGAAGQIGIWQSPTNIVGNANFQIDTVDSSLNLNGLRQSVLSAPITALDNQAAPAVMFTYDATLYNFAVIEYSIVRNGAYRTGRFIVAHDGSMTSSSDDSVETAITGIVLSADISGSDVRVRYTSTNTGFNGVFKYSMRRWS